MNYRHVPVLRMCMPVCVCVWACVCVCHTCSVTKNPVLEYVFHTQSQQTIVIVHMSSMLTQSLALDRRIVSHSFVLNCTIEVMGLGAKLLRADTAALPIVSERGGTVGALSWV